MRTSFLVLLGLLVLLAMASNSEALWHKKKSNGKTKHHSKIYQWFHRNDKKKEEKKHQREAAKKAEDKKSEPSKAGSKVDGGKKPAPAQPPEIESMSGRNSAKGGMGYLQSIGGGGSRESLRKEKELALHNMKKGHKYN